jgi:DNA-3-methyladenine glycosylase
MRERRGRASRRDTDLTNGPGKLCQALGIDGELNRSSLQKPPLVIRRGAEIPRQAVTVTPRVGISRCADWPLRWFISDSPYVSKTPASFSRVSADR